MTIMIINENNEIVNNEIIMKKWNMTIMIMK